MPSHVTLWLTLMLCACRVAAQSPCLTGIINSYTPVQGFGCDSSSLHVGPTAGFAAGDKVLLVQIQVPQVDLSNTSSFGALLNSTCIGNYEFNRILSINGNTVQLKFGLLQPYDISGKLQLVKVPEYDTAVVCGITCLPWDGSTGGIVALDVKTQLTLNGDIDVSGKGFRGGIVEPNFVDWFFGEQQFYYPPISTLAAAKGEGIVIIPAGQSFGRGRAGNGGGGGNAHNGGGGGGGNAGTGGDGGLEITNLPAAPTPNTNGLGGSDYFSNNFNKVLMGGGGGAGHANDTKGSSGGNGGGMVFIHANSLITNGFRVLSNGIDVLGGAEENDGQGGGGAGGLILLDIAQVNGTLTCEVKGGRGGSNPYTPAFQLHGPGGGGGGGKLLLPQNTPNVSAQRQGGLNGLTSQGLTNGALPGIQGAILTGFSVPTSHIASHPVSNDLQLVSQAPQCAGNADGQIGVYQSNALAFQINGGPWQPDSVFTNLPPGNYLIGLLFSGGCTLDTNVLIPALPPLADSLVALEHANCTEGGSIAVEAISGNPPFEFQLNNGIWAAAGIFSNLPAGNYIVTTRDATGCTHTSAHTINPPPSLLVSLIAQIDATCITGGSISLQASSGSPPFVFSLNGGAGQANGTFADLPAGNHSVLLTDAAGCTINQNFNIHPPPALADTLLALENATCVAGGSISVQAISGSPPFVFSLNGGAGQSSGFFPDLPAGNHSLLLTDAAGCSLSHNFSIDPPPALADTLLTLENATCVAGGSIMVQAISGSPPFVFSLNGGAGQPNGAFSDLPAGNHSVLLTDAVGCSLTQSYTIDPPPVLTDTLLNQENATCVAGGSISVQAVSGSPPFVFSLNGGAGQPNGAFSDLPAGNHSVLLTDAAGCSLTQSFAIDPPPVLTDTLLNQENATCVAGGSISVQAVSGSPPFVFSLNGGAGQSTGFFPDLPAGNHSVLLTDGAGCTLTQNYTIDPPPVLTDTLLNQENATCMTGGSISVQAVSGSPPFVYSLNGGVGQANGTFAGLTAGNYSLLLIDASGCTFSHNFIIAPPTLLADTLLVKENATCVAGGSIVLQAVSGSPPFVFSLNGGVGQANGTFSDLTAGNHSVLLTDAAGCTLSQSYTIYPPPPARDTLIGATEIGCTSLGSLTFQAVSGTAPFQFQVNSQGWQTSGQFQNLESGIYSVTMRDAAGCTYSSLHTIAPYTMLELVLDSIGMIDCAHDLGYLNASAIGGKGGYRFEIEPDGQLQTNGQFVALVAGTYNLTVIDSAGCEATMKGIEIQIQIDSVTTFQTITIYEGSSIILPDGQKAGRAGQYPFNYFTTDGCDSLHIINLVVLKRNVYVPNIFSPNSDGHNDFFSVYADASLKNVAYLEVYDRWGELVFEKRNFEPNIEQYGWDGNYREKPMGPGVYVWVLSAEFVDGVKLELKGDVTLIR